jgi:hypothetical protein
MDDHESERDVVVHFSPPWHTGWSNAVLGAPCIAFGIYGLISLSGIVWHLAAALILVFGLWLCARYVFGRVTIRRSRMGELEPPLRLDQQGLSYTPNPLRQHWFQDGCFRIPWGEVVDCVSTDEECVIKLRAPLATYGRSRRQRQSSFRFVENEIKRSRPQPPDEAITLDEYRFEISASQLAQLVRTHLMQSTATASIESANTADGSVPELAGLHDAQQPGVVPAVLLISAAALYVLLSWTAGALYNHGHELLAGLVGVVAAFAGMVAAVSVVWLVAPGTRSREGRLAKTVSYLAYILVILGVPALAWYLTH